MQFQALSEVSKTIPISDLKGLDVFKLNAFGISVATNKMHPAVISASTTAQLEYVLSLTQKIKPNVLTIGDVTEAIWHVFKHKMENKIKESNSEEGFSVKFESPNVTIVYGAEQSKCVKELNEFLTQLKNLEAEEEFTLDESSSNDALEWCKTLEQVGGENCFAVFVNESSPKKIIAMCESYEVMPKLKHKFKVLQKVIEPKNSGRERHAGDAYANVPDSQPSSAFKPVHFDWKVDAKNLKSFKTAEGLGIKVYKADICKLPVECIVNAANENLWHGGGVAFAIAKAAGYELEKEGKTYIDKHGPIPVGHVCVTTAGDLPYKYVIHAVGPKWDPGWNKTEQVYQCAEQLKDAIINSLKEADKKQLESIGLPAISSGNFNVLFEEEFWKYHKVKL